jgi:hypothetical protein
MTDRQCLGVCHWSGGWIETVTGTSEISRYF